MIYVSHAGFNAICELTNHLKDKGWSSTSSFDERENRYELLTDAPRKVVEDFIYRGSFPREVLEQAYKLEEV